jgi:uncharacterized beta-barrel protein YwiB (DUF1934 family)
MKKVHINSKLINNLNEEAIVDIDGEYIENENKISYYEKNILVTISIGDKVIVERFHTDYKIKLIFKENEKNITQYEIFNPKMIFDLEVETLSLEKKVNSLYIKYRLKLNNEDMGLFIFEINFE